MSNSCVLSTILYFLWNKHWFLDPLNEVHYIQAQDKHDKSLHIFQEGWKNSTWTARHDSPRQLLVLGLGLSQSYIIMLVRIAGGFFGELASTFFQYRLLNVCDSYTLLYIVNFKRS